MTAQRIESIATLERGAFIPEFTQGDRLRKAREATGLNARDFAKQIGVGASTVNNAEAERHAVRKIVMNAWSLATGVDRHWLETGHAAPEAGAACQLCGIGDSNPEPIDSYKTVSHLHKYHSPRLFQSTAA